MTRDLIPRTLLLVAAIATASCQRQPADATAGAPAEVAPAEKAPANPLSAAGPARMDGYAGLRFGMTAAEAARAWPGGLLGQPPRGEICYYLTPAGSGPEFMIEADKLVRYDVADAAQAAPGGGKLGMSMQEIKRLYPGQATEKPDPQAGGGHTIRIQSKGSGAIVFQSDANGQVQAWRVGMAPYVDYSRRCL